MMNNLPMRLNMAEWQQEAGQWRKSADVDG
jgi:hypothetical protein